jgi:hypothetical protein
MLYLILIRLLEKILVFVLFDIICLTNVMIKT